ncbi:MAG: hypothetical protein V4724_22075 [Pseudomonadota bacterium]
MLRTKFLGAIAALAAVAISSSAMAAGDRDFNTAAGAVIGAAIGSQNGSGGAVVGGLVGAAVGNSLGGGYHRGGGYVQTRVYSQPAPVYYQPAPVYYEPAPRYYAPATVYVEPARPYYYREYRGRDHYYRDEGRHGGHRGYYGR